MVHTPLCPACGRTDQVAKVSAIYLEGIRRTRRPGKGDTREEVPALAPLPAAFQAMPPSALGQLSRRLKPPESGRTQTLRPVHPDLAVLAFSLVAPLFLYEIHLSQPVAIIPVLAILAIFYVFYFWKRKSLLSTFEQQQDKRRQTERRVQQAIQRWMRLYYCECEDGVFEPGADSLIPADQMAYYLFQDE